VEDGRCKRICEEGALWHGGSGFAIQAGKVRESLEEEEGLRVLVLNNGSSTIKFDLVELANSSAPITCTLAHGQIDFGAHNPTLSVRASSGATLQRTTDVRSRNEAIGQALDAVSEVLSSQGALNVQAVGHRVVHGGDRFVSPVLVDGAVLSVLEGLNGLAPLHNPAALEGVHAAIAAFGPDVPMVAVFDTAFHATLPDYAYTYALPYDLAQGLRVLGSQNAKEKLRRYGFHGTAHEYMLNRYALMTGTSPQEATIITLQLGNGCSVTAIRNGSSVDTSMGFTPLEGLVMGTRSGDIDPGIVSYLAREERISADEVVRLLNERSGLLGISGRSSDMRDLLAAVDHDPRARLAIEVFCYRVRKYIGAYLAALEGVAAIVFGGGIGENAPSIRARICERFGWCGLRLDPERNDSLVGTEGRISQDGAAIAAHVVAVNEAILIAEQTARCLGWEIAAQ
jgi:acetate kinase